MAVTIDKVFIDEFEGNLISLAQQKETHLRSCVMEKASSGKSYAWDRIGPVNMSPKAGRGADTPVVDTPFSRRLAIPATYAVGDLVAEEETVQMLPDPTSAIAQQFAFAVNRQYDDVIIAAATGDSRDGDGNAVPFPAAQLLGDGTGTMDLAAITSVSEGLMENDLDPTAGYVWAISPAQAKQLLEVTEYNSYDFNALRPLMSGQVVPFMGFDFIVSTRLADGAAAGTSTRTFCMSKDALGLQVNNPIKARVAEDPNSSFDYRIYSEITIGAIRVEDEKVFAYDFAN